MISRSRAAPILAGFAIALLTSCHEARGPYQSDGSAARDVPRSDALYRQSLPILHSDPAQAEALLRQALGFDLYNGSAHNNLGVLLLAEHHLYDAAEEFEWARTLLPGHPEPRVNLAIALEQGGKPADALDAARSALEARPGNLPAIETIALIQVREHCADATTLADLHDIMLRSADPTWRHWAERQSVALHAAQQWDDQAH
jgi:tetratricopeptide (TPR) repeat protein